MWKPKRSFKEHYGSLAHFLKGDNDCKYIGDLYIEGTNFYIHREWRGVRDTAYAFGQWLIVWAKMAGLVASNPVRVAKSFFRYRWMYAYLAAPMMMDKWIEGDRGMALRADSAAVQCMVSDSVRTLVRDIRADRNLGGETKYTDKAVTFDYTLPNHIMYGFPGYYPINIQQHCAFMLPILNKSLGPYYIDQAVACGIPGDMCTLPLVETGVAVVDEYPDVGNCWVTTNTPCDAQLMDNYSMYRRISKDGEKAVHPLMIPMMYDDPTTKELGIHEIEDAIAFLEEQLHQPFNWETFKKHLAATNDFNREEVERWDIYATTDNGPLNPVCQGMFRIYFYQQGGNKYFAKASKKINKVFYKCVQKDIKPFPQTRHRAIAWSCGSTYYCHGVEWLYNCWGILTVINMDSLTGHNIIDLEDRHEMMSDLADWYGRTPMRTHVVGGARHVLQMWETAQKFNCDMIIMYDDIGCKGIAGAQGLIEEELRKHADQFHLVWMPHALMDCRIVPPADARAAVNNYMRNILHEEPVDPSLENFDDSMGW